MKDDFGIERSVIVGGKPYRLKSPYTKTCIKRDIVVLDDVPQKGGDSDPYIEIIDGVEYISCDNQGGYDSTAIDLDALLAWLSKNRKEYYTGFLGE